jgi:SAM-dependent methyltransferase
MQTVSLLSNIIDTLLYIFVLSAFVTYLFACFSGAPWVPTKGKDVRRFLKLADVKPGQKMYDLGCGDGRLACATAKMGAESVGFEISLYPYILAKIRVFFSKNKEKVKILFKSFWHADLQDADIVFVWTLPATHNKIGRIFKGKLKKGCKVVSFVWPIEGWQPKVVDAPENSQKLFLYEV